MSCAALNPIFRAIFANSRFVHCSLAHSLLLYLIPHNKDQYKRYNNYQVLSFQPLTLFILACEHNNQTNGKPSNSILSNSLGHILYCCSGKEAVTVLFKAFTSQKLCSNAFLVFRSYEAVVGTCPDLHRTRVSAHAFEKPLYFLFVIRSCILIPFFRHFAKRKNRYKVYEAEPSSFGKVNNLWDGHLLNERGWHLKTALSKHISTPTK